MSHMGVTRKDKEANCHTPHNGKDQANIVRHGHQHDHICEEHLQEIKGREGNARDERMEVFLHLHQLLGDEDIVDELIKDTSEKPEQESKEVESAACRLPPREEN